MTVDVAADIESVVSSHDSLLHTIDGLTDEDAREPSLLPSWTRGHVLTHVARNADGLVNLLTWARTGVETPMYESRDKRAADIEAGSTRPVAELTADLRDSQQRLLDALGAMSETDWTFRIRFGRDGNEIPASMIPALRFGEIEVHNVDLDLDYTPAHWPEPFVESLLSRACGDFSARPDTPGLTLRSVEDDRTWRVGDGAQVITGPPPALLAWLVGRTDGTGLHADGGILPKLGPWR